MRNFPEKVEAEADADRLALVTPVVEHDAVGLGHDLLEAKGKRVRTIQPRPPVGIQFRSTAMNLHAVAVALEARVRGVEVEKRGQIARPARIQPIDHNGNSVKIFKQFGILIRARAWLPRQP
jgi:hypothetical protein